MSVKLPLFLTGLAGRRSMAALMWCLVILSSRPSAVSAQTIEAQRPVIPDEGIPNDGPTTATSLPPALNVLVTLPAAFSKSVPESVDDLRMMEEHIAALVPKLMETTVALTIGNAQGSGVIVSKDGYVLTAAHVSGRPEGRVHITLSDGTQAYGHSLGRNKTLDASLVKIDSPIREWPYVPMARLEDIDVGEWSIVTGHPGGYIPGRPPVFRLGRVIHVDEQVIQTDNELVGGDSGGPLFDMHGRVIGINSRIGPATSFNLHTPINAYTDFWPKLVAGESFILHSGALLGVQGESHPQGLKLTKVWENEPAGVAGLQTGDVLLTFQREPVHQLSDLIELVGGYPPGRRVRVTVLRGDEELSFRVRLGSKENRNR